MTDRWSSPRTAPPRTGCKNPWSSQLAWLGLTIYSAYIHVSCSRTIPLLQPGLCFPTSPSNDRAGRRVEYSLEGENICNSRGSEETVDTVPPGHFQVLRVTSELVVRSANGVWLLTLFCALWPERTHPLPRRARRARRWGSRGASLS